MVLSAPLLGTHMNTCAYMCLRYTDKLPDTVENYDGKPMEYCVYCSASGVD